jgi:uncharacterized protein (TIGR00369 family)
MDCVPARALYGAGKRRIDPLGREEHFRKLERMYASGPTNLLYGSQLQVSEGCAEVIIPVRSEFFHPGGAAHGSVYFKALDDAAFFAANSLVEDVFMLTVSFHLYFMRPISEGHMKSTGRVVQQSARMIIAEAEVVDSEGREIARGSGMFLPSSIPLTPEVGYA